MTARISSLLLRAWDGIWEVPELWLMSTLAEDLDADEVARMTATREGNRLSPETAFACLLDLGEFGAAELLLTHEGFSRAANDALRQRLENDELPRARRRAYLDAANRYLSLALRAERMGIRLPDSPQSEAMRSRRVAAEKLMRIDLELCDREAPHVEEMKRRLAERLKDAKDTQVGALQDNESGLRIYELAVRRALDSRDLTLAAALLKQAPGAFSATEASSAPRLPVSAPLSLMVDWFLLRAPRPASLDRYLPAPDDAVARTLIEALARIDRLDPVSWTLSEIEVFVATLIRFLGVRELAPLREVEGGFLAVLAGFESVGVPALGDAARPHGTPLWIPRQASAQAPVLDDPLTIIFHPDRVALQSVGELRFDGATLLALAHLREGRASALAWTLAVDLPLDRVVPWTDSRTHPLPDPSASLGRDQAWSSLCSADRLSILVGAPGNGKTSLLERFVRAWPQNNVLRLSAASVLATPLKLLEACSLLVVDDADTPDSATGDAVERRCRDVIHAAISPPRIVLARRWPGGDRQQGSLVQVGHLSLADSRRLLRQLVDPISVAFDTVSSLDRVAFLSGGSPGLLMILLDALLARHGGRRSRQSVVLTLEQIDEVWRDPISRGRVVAALERAFAGHEHLRRTLAAIVIAGDRSSYSEPYVLSSTDLVEALELLEGAPPDAARVATDIEALTSMGLIEDAGRERVRLPLSGVAELCAEVCASTMSGPATPHGETLAESG